MSSKILTITVDIPKNGWIKFNSNADGYYRVEYPKNMLKSLFKAIETKELGPLDRLNMNDDSFALANSGQLSIVDYLKSLQSFKNEDEYTVWSSIDYSLEQLSLLYSNTNFKEKFYSYVRAVMEPHCKTLGLTTKKDDKATTIFLRSLCLERLGLFGNPDVIKEARDKFYGHFSMNKVIDHNYEEAIYNVAANNMTEQEFDNLFSVSYD